MKKSLQIIMLVLCFILYNHQSTQAQTVAELREWEMDVDKVIKLNRLLKAYSWLKDFSGIVLVAKGEHSVFKYTSSYANLDYKIPNSLTTRYNLSNITHIITATIIMQLIEEGKISRFDYVKDYLPDLPLALSEKVTIHHLLTHTSGIKDYYETADYIIGFTKIRGIDDALKIILKQPLEFAVGTKAKISQSNYVLLAKIIETFTNTPYHQYIQEKIFEVAEMEDSSAYYWDETISNKAIGYTFKENGNPIIPANYWGAFPFGADALYSTSEDLLRFMNAFHTNKFLSAESMSEMFKYGVPAADSTTVQYGWRTKKMDTQEVLLQNGKIEGLSVDMRYYPKDAYTVIVLSNCFDGRAIEMANRVEKVLYDESFVVAAHPLGFFLNEIIKESGVEFVSNNINNILKTNGYELEKVWTLYSLGYDLMDAGKMDEAGEIFKINVSKFPQEPMAYDSLGAYYDKVDENRLALQNFERKLQLSPGDKRAKSMITYLKAEIAKE